MDEALRYRRVAFGAGIAVIAIVSIAVARLPDTLLIQVERNRPFSEDQATWVLWLLALAATGYALYGGLVLLRPERIERDLRADEALARAGRPRILRTVTRNAVLALVLTVVFGLAVVGLTGERGGYWLFVLLAAAQGAWFYRAIRIVGEWLALQPALPPEPEDEPTDDEPAGGYTPPLARGVTPRDP